MNPLAISQPLEVVFQRYAATADPAALAEVYERQAPRLTVLAARLVSNRSDIEDLVHETFLRAMRAAASCDPTQPLSGWLYGILRRVAWERSRRAREAQLACDPPDCVGGTEPMFAAEVSAAIDRALLRVPGHYRELLRRRLIAGQRAVDIANEMRLPIATVRSKLQRGLRMLRAALPFGLASMLCLAFAPRALAQGQRRLDRALAAKPALSMTALLLLAAALLVLAGGSVWLQHAGLASSPGASVLPLVAATEDVAPSKEPLLSRDAADSQVILRGFIDVGTAYSFTNAVLVAFAAPVDLLMARPPMMVLDPNEQELACIARQCLQGPECGRAQVAADGSFELVTSLRDVVLDLRDDVSGLLLPMVAHVPAGQRELQLPVLFGYVGCRLQGFLPAGVSPTEVTLHCMPEMHDPFADATIVQLARDQPLRADVEGRSFVFSAVLFSGVATVVATDVHGNRWYQFIDGDAPVRQVAPLQQARERLEVCAADPELAGTMDLIHEHGLQVGAVMVDGRAVVTDLLPGKYQGALCTHDGRTITFEADLERCSHVSLPATQERQCIGIVRTTRNLPVAGAQIVTLDPRARGAVAIATTDDEGAFSVTVGGATQLLIDAGHGRKQLVRPRGDRPLRIEVPDLIAVRGRLLLPPEERGACFGYALIHGSDGEDIGCDRRPVRIAADGGFCIANVAATALRLDLTIAGVASAGAELPRRAVDNDECDLGDLQVQRWVAVRGQVFDPEQRPVAGAFVAVLPPGIPEQRSTRARLGRTAADGTFTLMVPPDNSVDVIAHDRGHAMRWRGSMEASERIVLQPLGAVTGRVDGSLPGGTGVLLLSPEGIVRLAPIARDGSFRCVGLPAGDYRLSLVKADQPCIGTAARQVRVASGETVWVEFAGSVPVARLTLELTSPIVPMADLMVVLQSSDASEPPVLHPACESSEFELSPGEWTVQLVRCDGLPHGLGRRLRLAATAAKLAITLPTTAVRGRLLGPRGDAATVLVVPKHADWVPVPATIANDGTFELGGVDPEQVSLFAVDPSREPALSGVAAGTSSQLFLQPAGWLERSPSCDPSHPVLLKACDGLCFDVELPRDERTGRVLLPAGVLDLVVGTTLRQHVVVGAGQSVAIAAGPVGR